MPFPMLVAALALGQELVPPVAIPDFSSPFTVVEPVRLAITPKIDGIIEPEEWDAASSSEGLKSFLQWEPGKVHVAGVCGPGQDLVLSLDMEGNGWLVGNDNIEVRITGGSGTPKVTARRLDAKNVQGPEWTDLPGVGLAAKAAAKTTELQTVYEVTLTDPSLGIFPTVPDRGLNVRVDAVPTATPPLAAFLPRATAPVKFSFARAAAIPEGLKWGIQGEGSSTLPGGAVKIRYTFNGTDKLGLQKLALSSEGRMKETTTQKSMPFPIFDHKGRAFVDYQTDVRPDAELGWVVSKGELTAGDGLTAIIETSYRVAPVTEIKLAEVKIVSKPIDQRIKTSYEIVSNAPRRLVGVVKVTLPASLKLVSPSESRFLTSGGRARTRMSLEFDLPANTKGVFPVQIRTEIDGVMTDNTAYLNVN